ncbi:hypothetical protein C0J52_20743 [Blattella germanica]|nr:hypothetical protein C0J52_20743 [Blattella germanica]
MELETNMEMLCHQRFCNLLKYSTGWENCWRDSGKWAQKKRMRNKNAPGKNREANFFSPCQRLLLSP